MKKYVTETKDTCWTDCLACLLEVKPSKVPKFVKLYGNKYMDMTRLWLKENFRKGLVYIPARAFMETGVIRQNSPIGPTGYSIGHLSMVDNTSTHVVICYNGGVLWDNGEDRSEEYGSIQGYFVIYELEPERARWVKKPIKRKRNKKI